MQLELESKTKRIGLEGALKFEQTEINAFYLLEENGYSTAVINARFVKPLDEDVIVNFARKVKLVVTIEENTIYGGFGSGILEVLSKKSTTAQTMLIGAPDRFIEQGSRDEQLVFAELSPEQVFKRISQKLSFLAEFEEKNKH